MLRVDLDGTGAADQTFSGSEIHFSEHDWLNARVVDQHFEASCGPLNLGEAIHTFRLWVKDLHSSHLEHAPGKCAATSLIRRP